MIASVIIPTRNRAAKLDGCLKSLTRQTAPLDAFEVLVIDNGSSDQSTEIIRSYTSSLKLTYHRAPKPGLHVGRHEGMRRAKADVLMFADDDIEAAPSWIEAVLKTFEDPNVALVGGNIHPLFEQAPPPWLRYWWQKSIYKGRALPWLSILEFGDGVFQVDPRYVWGCNFSIRRKFLLKAGGFHPDGFPRELLRFRGDGETHVSDFLRCSGLKAVFNSLASVHHIVSASRMTQPYLEQRAFAQGISDSYTAVRLNGGLDFSPAVKAHRFVNRITCLIKSKLSFYPASGDSLKEKLREVQIGISSAYWRGYRFHQHELRVDPNLLLWVLKEDYL